MIPSDDTLRPADYVGRSETTTGRVERGPLELMAALLDRSFDEIAPEENLPRLWHWCLFQQPVPESAIGPDGHPRHGSFMPPVDLPRRMFAGARTEWRRELRIGEDVTRTQMITSVTPKSGRSGELLFVTVRAEIGGAAGPAIIEEQDIVYSEKGPPVAAPTDRKEVPTGDWEQNRRSRAGHDHAVPLFGGDRQQPPHHYDLRYTRDVESYPDLLVHGPLLAILLADHWSRHHSYALARFAFQAKRPAFLGTRFHCCSRIAAEGTELAIIDDFGQVCMTAEARG